MTRLLFIFALITIAIPSLAQTEELDESKMVGFGCFYEGRETKLVSKFGKMLKRKQYSSIARELSSDNSGARVMAVFCLERLQAINKRPLTENEKVVIDQIKSSTELVSVCSGCFPTPGIPIRQVFITEILWGARPWLERHAKD